MITSMWFTLRVVSTTEPSVEPARDAVVRSIARAAARPCARPGCPAPASATLSFRYGSQEAWLGELQTDATPETYDLCGTHADRTRPPHGWQLVDRRPADERTSGPEDFGDQRTVAVLKAALHGDDADPSPVLEADPMLAEPAPSRAGSGDEDLAAVLSALVAELDAQPEVEPHDGVEDDTDGVTPGDEVAVLMQAVDALQADLTESEPTPQERLPFDAPAAARDW